jgi:SAM-dependent methyltransferase
MDEMKLLIDLHKDGERQGPGGTGETERALNLARIDRNAALKIADIGCCTGASTIVLAKLLNARITAVDFIQDFLDVLIQKATAAGVANQVSPLACSMEDLPFAEGEFDDIWSEGAIYNIGFAKGADQWRTYLKPGGLLVVSEITWITDSRPAELQQHWEQEYPEIETASARFRVLERHGYSPTGYFTMPESCWLDHYYRPMQGRFAGFLARNGNSEPARALVAETRQEITLYEKYKAHFSYGFYIARKP